MISAIRIVRKSPQGYNWEKTPANLPSETLAQLESAVKAVLKDGYLHCPVGWKIAEDMAIPRIAIGPVMDKLGVRIANCQLGFFRVDKTPPGDESHELSQDIATGLRDLDSAGNLTCAAAFELARRLKITPMKVSKAANALGLKIRSCQLGCF